jgi:uncharacterized repeat protein (TIGR01451 family)
VTCTYTDSRILGPPASLFKQTVGGFGGPFSFQVTTPDGAVVPLSASTTADGQEVKAGDLPAQTTGGNFVFHETLPPDPPTGSWSLQGVTCNGSPQPVSDNQVTVQAPLGAPPISCTFIDEFTPKTGSITITKTTQAGFGGPFAFVVTPNGDRSDIVKTRDVRTLRATTSAPNTPTTATGDDLSKLALGDYDIAELVPPHTDQGTWRSQPPACDQLPRSSGAGIVVSLTPDRPNVTCSFMNVLVPLPTPSPTAISTATPSHTPTSAATPTNTATSTLAPTSTATLTSTSSPTSTPTTAPTPTDTPIGAPTATNTPTAVIVPPTTIPTNCPTVAPLIQTLTATATATTVATPTASVTASLTVGATSVSSAVRSGTPTSAPAATSAPTNTPQPTNTSPPTSTPQPPAADTPQPVRPLTLPAPDDQGPSPEPALDTATFGAGRRLAQQAGECETPVVTNTPTATPAATDTPAPPSTESPIRPTATPVTAPPQLAVTKTVDQPTAAVGDTLTFSITVSNPGTTPLVDTQVEDLLPAGLSFVNASNGGIYDPSTRMIGWALTGGLGPGASQQLSYRATLSEPGAWVNTACSDARDAAGNEANACDDATVTPPGVPTPTPTATSPPGGGGGASATPVSTPTVAPTAGLGTPTVPPATPSFTPPPMAVATPTPTLSQHQVVLAVAISFVEQREAEAGGQPPAQVPPAVQVPRVPPGH